MGTQRNVKKWLSGSHLFILLVSAHFGYGRLAVHLHMSICRVVCGPRQIGWVPSQLVFNGAPICIEPLIKTMQIYGIMVFCLDVSLDRQLYGNFCSSEHPVTTLVSQLYVSEVGRKPLGLQHKTLHFGFHLSQFIL